MVQVVVHSHKIATASTRGHRNCKLRKDYGFFFHNKTKLNRDHIILQILTCFGERYIITLKNSFRK